MSHMHGRVELVAVKESVIMQAVHSRGMCRATCTYRAATHCGECPLGLLLLFDHAGSRLVIGVSVSLACMTFAVCHEFANAWTPGLHVYG